jgi:phosphatidylglycerol---prolipoprotein diacylglyceryl transferase
MHPILFRIPLPTTALPLGWILLGAAAIAAALAGWQFYTKKKQNAGILAAVAAALVLGRVYLSGKPELTSWEMSPIPIYSYGVMLGLSLVVGWYLTLGLAEREGLPKEIMANNYVVTAVAAVLGSRILYILTNLDEFDTIGSMFAMRRGGLVAYGGFLGGFVGSLLFLRRYKIPLLPWADVAVPSLASGLMITRIGCYLFGCDFGKPLKETAPALLKKLGTFPHWTDGTLEHGSGSPAWAQHVKQQLIPATADASLPVHPTQIYESLVGALLLGFLLFMRRYQKFRGQIFLLFTFAYGICRFLLEIFRDDAERGSIPPALQEHVLLSLSLTVLSAGYVIGFSKMIANPTVQRVTQVLAFVPPVLVFIIKRPETFAQAEMYQLSTSQFVAVTTGFAACVAFNVFYKAAVAHPESAMNLGLPPDLGQEPGAPAAALDDDDDGEEERPARKKERAKADVAAAREAADAAPGKTKKKKKKKGRGADAPAAAERATEPKAEAGDDHDDDDRPPKAAKPADDDDEATKPADDDDEAPKAAADDDEAPKKKKAAGATDDDDEG